MKLAAILKHMKQQGKTFKDEGMFVTVYVPKKHTIILHEGWEDRNGYYQPRITSLVVFRNDDRAPLHATADDENGEAIDDFTLAQVEEVYKRVSVR